MDRLRDFLETAKRTGVADGNFQGLLHVLVGRKITSADGEPISAGLSWRETAAELKRLRWKREAVKELGINPRSLPPRDRQRFWYTAIAQAGLDSSNAVQAGDKLATALKPLGYFVGPAPGKEPA